MRKLLFISLCLVVFTSCKKQDNIKIPLHKSSLEWLMDVPTGYTNNSGDTLFAWQYDEVNEYVIEGAQPNGLEKAQLQSIVQSFKIDTVLEYQTTLIAELTNEIERHDFVGVRLWNIGTPLVSMSGVAEPENWLNGTFSDSVELNSILYFDVFSQSNTQNLEMFVNLDKGLVGFVLDADTFNIVK